MPSGALDPDPLWTDLYPLLWSSQGEGAVAESSLALGCGSRSASAPELPALQVVVGANPLVALGNPGSGVVNGEVLAPAATHAQAGEPEVQDGPNSQLRTFLPQDSRPIVYVPALAPRVEAALAPTVPALLNLLQQDATMALVLASRPYVSVGSREVDLHVAAAASASAFAVMLEGMLRPPA